MTISNYIVHAPIRIDSNIGFALQAASEGWNGTGSSSSPWIIENYDINGSGLGDCIYIGNVTSHFEIRNCSLHDANTTTISLYQVNGGIHLYNTENATLHNNTVFRNEYNGIWLMDCEYTNYITNNTVFQNKMGGIQITRTNYTFVENNTVTNNTDSGIDIYYDAHDNFVLNNTCRNNRWGIFLRASNDCHIDWNTMEYNWEIGLHLSSADSNLIRNNSIINNELGVYLSMSDNNVAYHNDIIGNANNSYNSNSFSVFDNGYLSGGNYWSDYSGTDGYSGPQVYVIGVGMRQNLPGSDGLGDTGYILGGYGYSHDNYPLMHPIHRTWVDSASPQSSVEPIIPYWHSTQTTMEINATANDTGGSGVSDVTLWYRSSSDNSSWSAWTEYSTDFSAPWSWNFNFPGGEHYYEFYSNSSDIAGNQEAVIPTTEANYGLDDSKPASALNPIGRYYFNSSSTSIILSGNASDTYCGLSEVSLWYRYSEDNITWGNWTYYDSDMTAPYSWNFNMHPLEGMYEFYSVAMDNIGNIESPPASADTSCMLDMLRPHLMYTYPNPHPGTTGEPITLWVNVTDNYGIQRVEFRYNFGTINNNFTTVQVNSTTDYYELTIDVPSNAAGYLSYSYIAWDYANQSEVGGSNVRIIDNDAPIANVSHQESIYEGDTVQLSGSNSSDNMGIANYTWKIGSYTLYGEKVNFTFINATSYTVSLLVCDAEGNNDTKTVSIKVYEIPDYDDDGTPDDQDEDDDNDGVPDSEDAFPYDSSETLDTDNDTIGNNADLDDDGDGVPDIYDDFPLDPLETIDTDHDGIGNNADLDDDGDGILDVDDAFPLDPDIDTDTNLDEDNNLILYLAVVIVIVVAVLSGLILIRYRRNKTLEPKQ